VPPPRRTPSRPIARRPKVAGTRNRSGSHDAGDTFESIVDSVTEDIPFEQAPAAVEPEPEPEVTPEPEAVEPEPVVKSPGLVRTLSEKGLLVPLVLVLVALVIAGLGFWFRGEAQLIEDSGSGANHALSDTGGTTEVTTQITRAMETVSSYKYTDLDAAQKAGQAVSTGKFLGEYNQLFTQVKTQAPAQKAVVTGQVAKISVRVLQGDSAILLAFLNQTTTRADNNQPNSIGLVYTVTAQRVDGKWKISDLQPR
jgi:Mce-associated membrane protein